MSYYDDKRSTNYVLTNMDQALICLALSAAIDEWKDQEGLEQLQRLSDKFAVADGIKLIFD